MAASDTRQFFGKRATVTGKRCAGWQRLEMLADEVAETAARYLGLVLGQVLFDCRYRSICIGGGGSRAGQFLVDKIDKYYQNIP